MTYAIIENNVVKAFMPDTNGIESIFPNHSIIEIPENIMDEYERTNWDNKVIENYLNKL